MYYNHDVGSSRRTSRPRRSAPSRQRIIDAAGRLFVEQGYVASTIEEIAAAAGVAVQTVYYVFGTKPNVLAGVLDATIAGGDAAVPIVEQPWVAKLDGGGSPGGVAAPLVAVCVDILARAAPIYGVLRSAAADPEIGALLDANRAGRRSDQRAIVERLHRGGHLRADIEVDAAADIFYALVNEDVYALLVDDCGWEVDRFSTWLTTTLEDQLLST